MRRNAGAVGDRRADTETSAAFGGTSFWIEGPEGLDADLLMNALRKDGVLIESGSPFFPQDDGPCRFFRMGYSSIARNRIADGVALTAARTAERGRMNLAASVTVGAGKGWYLSAFD
jgi:GntR family transcriptional regulator/MocR family aminotransferase